MLLFSLYNFSKLFISSYNEEILRPKKKSLQQRSERQSSLVAKEKTFNFSNKSPSTHRLRTGCVGGAGGGFDDNERMKWIILMLTFVF